MCINDALSRIGKITFCKARWFCFEAPSFPVDIQTPWDQDSHLQSIAWNEMSQIPKLHSVRMYLGHGARPCQAFQELLLILCLNACIKNLLVLRKWVTRFQRAWKLLKMKRWPFEAAWGFIVPTLYGSDIQLDWAHPVLEAWLFAEYSARAGYADNT